MTSQVDKVFKQKLIFNECVIWQMSRTCNMDFNQNQKSSTTSQFSENIGILDFIPIFTQQKSTKWDILRIG